MNTTPPGPDGAQHSLRPGVCMPSLGLGVYRTPHDNTAHVVSEALRVGYRLIDTAAAYGNEAHVGEGVRASGVPRDDVFVTTKLWIPDYGYDSALRACDASLRALNLGHIDLYLLHWPAPDLFDLTLDAWRACEKLLRDGVVKAIGVSNFEPAHLQALVGACDVPPAVNQIELHPFHSRPDVRAANTSHGVVTQSWSPLGGIHLRKDAAPTDVVNPLAHPTVTGIAERLERTPAQVVLRWHLQQGLSVIPKTARTSRLPENFAVWDFTLSELDMSAIDALNVSLRGGPDPRTYVG